MQEQGQGGAEQGEYPVACVIDGPERPTDAEEEEEADTAQQSHSG
jgi:hypothetical protein